MTADVPNSLNWVSFVTGILSFGLTILNLIALYGNFVATIRAAPSEIRDSLGNLRHQLCEEREALRYQTKEIRSNGRLRQRITSVNDRLASHEARKTFRHAEKTLPLHYMTLRDLWCSFKDIERPFLVASGFRAETILNGAAWSEGDLDEKVRPDLEKHGEADSFADWSALYKCDFMHRFIWWQVKDDVKKLSDEVGRIMARRTEREVTSTRMMVKQLFNGDVPPQIIEAHPRRPPGGGSGGGATKIRTSRGSGPVRRSSVQVRRSPAPSRRSPVPIPRRQGERLAAQDDESSSSGQSSDSSSQTPRKGMDVPRREDGSPAASESQHDAPNSDAATVGKRQQRPQPQQQDSKTRWEQFRSRPTRQYDIIEYFEGEGRDHSKVIEVIPESEIDYFSQRFRQRLENK
ncbi:hypothetical protein CGRA01v4_08194 [Colletotrichum graminicola]|uniref:Uncharacterized protein n=1 Tax=Colletotrichum graminicola (strain M1.001 / M2 / FGSC 10212) TaxID=645133 RepID=E3QV37_COLGM|nr:uncharacterized protein GLRG_09871 [Colletotrichum graminicola M1.001]EFQ34727.1 hypothetical protein GLRG_09871 [Colletotrichum graminicola M1.001]WDK16911.1 hypothetical protein CGRA01v4_08194 [Colletotrichum graminicola]